MNQSVIIKDALHNASKSVLRNETDVAYARGVIVGIVAGIMSQGFSWQQSWELVKSLLPKDFDKRCVPHGWN